VRDFKPFLVKHFEEILISIILGVTIVGTWAIEEKTVLLNFYYLPVLSAGYFLGRRQGVLTAVLSIVIVLVFVMTFPNSFFKEQEPWIFLSQVLPWGGFLILASAAVGTLYEQNERRQKDLKNAYVGVLEILTKYLESSDRYTKGHSVRVSELAMDIATAMKLPRTDVENIRVAGLLHDIGKIEVSGEILLKAAELSSEEKDLMQEHTVKGGYLLSSVGSVLKDVVPIVVAHHRCFMGGDGGRPDAIDGTNIPIGARVVAVADAFDAMTNDRPYRKGMPLREALEEIVRNSGKQFDPEVVEAFTRVMSGNIKED